MHKPAVQPKFVHLTPDSIKSGEKSRRRSEALRRLFKGANKTAKIGALVLGLSFLGRNIPEKVVERQGQKEGQRIEQRQAEKMSKLLEAKKVSRNSTKLFTMHVFGLSPADIETARGFEIIGKKLGISPERALLTVALNIDKKTGQVSPKTVREYEEASKISQVRNDHIDLRYKDKMETIEQCLKSYSKFGQSERFVLARISSSPKRLETLRKIVEGKN